LIARVRDHPISSVAARRRRQAHTETGHQTRAQRDGTAGGLSDGKSEGKDEGKIKNPLGLAPYDPADYLRTPKEVAMYLEAFFEDGVDHEALVHALGVVAQARGCMSKLAKETGISRQRLYKAIAKDANPSFETVMKIVGAFGVRLSAQAS
jgi:probable addiction module antidote protein